MKYETGKIVNCICCNKEISLLEPTEILEHGMWNDGVVDKIAANYGSTLDGDMFIIGICDECLKAKLTNGTILYAGNYMFPKPQKSE